MKFWIVNLFLISFLSLQANDYFVCEVDSALKTVHELSGEDSISLNGDDHLLHTRRFSHVKNKIATNYLINRINKLGYTHKKDHYSFYDTENIIFEKEGVLYPDKYFIVCAHYDSENAGAHQNPDTLAPGACDNASSVAAILEVARNIKNLDLNYTVQFILFDTEEAGLYGSNFHLKKISGTKMMDDLLGVLNLDMIAQSESNNACELRYREIGESRIIANRMLDKINELNIDLQPEIILSNVIKSDSHIFWENDVSTLFFTQQLRNMSFYHSDYDVVEYFNIPFYENMIHAVYNTVIDLAQKGISTSIKKYTAGKDILLYPNPANDFINIKSENTITELKLYNFLGKEFSLDINENSLKLQKLKLADFEKGLYFLHIRTKQGLNVHKIIKN